MRDVATIRVVTEKEDARLRAWERLSRIRRRRWIAALAVLPGALFLGCLQAAIGPQTDRIFSALALLGMLVVLGFMGAPVFVSCPDCGELYEWAPLSRSKVTTRCMHCEARVPRDAFTPRRVLSASSSIPDVPALPAETPLTRYASAREWEIVHPNAIVGEVRGVRVAIERPERGTTTIIDCDADAVDAAALHAAIAARVEGSRATKMGSIVRVELPSAEIEPAVLDEALDLVVEASTARGGDAYR